MTEQPKTEEVGVKEEVILDVLPPQSDWECRLVEASLTFRPNKGDEPNRFHMLMHRLVFGFRWSKVNVGS